jgi:hypothetical protein
MEIQPLWTKRVDLNSRALDPLGLSRISDFLVDELLPGLTVMTSLGRNYCFYCWAIQQANHEKPQSYAQYIKILERLEAAYVVGGLLDQRENFPNAKGPIGRNRGLTAIWTEVNGKINLNFSVLKHQGGGLGQYYRNPMTKLGLIVFHLTKDELIPDGKILANCFDENIRETQYYLKFLTSEEVPIDILQEYGQCASYLHLKDYPNELIALSTILFEKNKNLSQNNFSRKATLHIILDLFKLYSDSQLEFDEAEFRNIVYYHQSVKEGKLIEYYPSLDPMKKTLFQWRFFQFHYFFTLAIESIFNAFLDSLEDTSTGLTLTEFTNQNLNFVETLNSLLEWDSGNHTISETFEKILKFKGIKGLPSKKTSELFDKTVQIEDTISEESIRAALIESVDRNEKANVIGLSFCLLFVAIIRYWQYVDSFDENNLWIANKEDSEFDIRTYMRKIRADMSKMTLIDLFKQTLQEIIDTHDTIAWDKMRSGNDTFRYHHIGGFFSFKMEYKPENRGFRFNSIRSIFEDLGFIEKIDDQFFISTLGVQFLEGFRYD